MITSENSTKIASALTSFVRNHPDRVRIRFSGGGDDVPFTANPETMDCSGIVCPQQTGKTKNCGTCTLCWTSKMNITFLGHSRALNEDHHALTNGTTIFLKTVKDVADTKNTLKMSSNDKLGKKIVKGAWKDSYFMTLTLEERATCPRSCTHWDDCYGNGMRFAQRMKTDGLMESIEAELAALSPKKKFTIRLHVLGDFYSVEYVEFWDRMMKTYDNITIFGYTAHAVDNSHLFEEAS